MLALFIYSEDNGKSCFIPPKVCIYPFRSCRFMCYSIVEIELVVAVFIVIVNRIMTRLYNNVTTYPFHHFCLWKINAIRGNGSVSLVSDNWNTGNFFHVLHFHHAWMVLGYQSHTIPSYNRLIFWWQVLSLHEFGVSFDYLQLPGCRRHKPDWMCYLFDKFWRRGKCTEASHLQAHLPHPLHWQVAWLSFRLSTVPHSDW